jgi:hypothetical protein
MAESLFSSEGRPRRILSHSVLLTVTSLFFFIWAIYNTSVKHYFDIGLVCFPFTIATGVYGSLIVSNQLYSHLHFLQRAIVLSYLVTIIAYISSLCLAPITKVTYVSYCIIASALWGLDGLYFHFEVIRLAQETEERPLLHSDKTADPHSLG